MTINPAQNPPNPGIPQQPQVPDNPSPMIEDEPPMPVRG